MAMAKQFKKSSEARTRKKATTKLENKRQPK
jgi:hypothetical protein